MPKCGPEYMKLVRTASGLTPDNPWKPKFGLDLPTFTDYQEWRAKAGELVEATKEKVVYLADLKRGVKDTENTERFLRWKSVVNEMSELEQRLRELGPALEQSAESLLNLELSWNEDIQEAVEISVAAVCLMEIVDQEFMELGKTPPRTVGIVTPGGKSEGGRSALGTVVALAVAGGVVYGVVKLSKRGETAAVEGA